ncbi:Uncharacterized protein OS=Myxococcus sp. (contaminant ex DSM 436) GN=A176_04436 PE=4 SV=1 [Gemmata massiliana]|uniref:Uncharacterized protein n=1 Tax=Gemmata massiliana TaxID=1210884 RepID=A0A6P2D315_9BACT|nr:hypothetical protein [Gemmata massiliana]VTR95691.1 Uncharacterized protein OS=Myxococcus sp. (contaminant ex DSM 436) GN=A176_04436 PE=4 SV=1 [Gemmata massiliana]
MPKLNQINAVVTARKGDAEKQITELYKLIQKEQLFTGRERTYRPLDEVNGQKLPPESQRVQQRADDLIRQAREKWTELWNLVLTQDTGNQSAKADVVVDGKAVLANVPITTLLFLDKQVNDLETFVSKLPTPDPAEEWAHDPNSGLLRSKANESLRTSKEPTVIVKYDATKEHPAQTELFTKDVPVGTWTQILYSGCIAADRKNAILARVRKLQDAIKVAKEQANLLEIERQKAAEALFGYVFGE